ncbi:lipoprotein [Spiroplasma endosymbiont of Polydrusus pterygomalis]|uniref:lipoprotein n=1 Tax=Spiroplasma endosymbiont of Polydrusus pterygomalis TaxID=3139327 RepID=UPI003CCAB924
MKKLLSIFTMTVLTITTSTNIIACNNSNVPIPTINTVKFKLMDRIKEATALAVDTKGNLYASDKKGNIYKCLTGENEFKKFATINIETEYNKTIIKIDNDDNFLIINNQKIYKCLAKEESFQEIFNFNESIWSITVDKNNNIYTGSSTGKLYKCSAGENIFSEVTNIQRLISSIVIDKNNNIFLLSIIVQQDSEIYKCLAGESTFNKIAEIEKPFIDFTLDKNNNIYIIDNGISVYKMLSNNKDIHVINNQLFFGNNTIITDQKNKFYISNSYYGVYKSD